MRKKESTSGVVRICVRLGELVVHPMVTAPLVDVILQGHGVGKCEKKS